MAERIKTGLLGAGVFASYHAAKITASEHTEFTGIFDTDHARAGALAAAHSTRAYASVDDLLTTCEALIIATPARTHFAQAHLALSAGCHVLVEKPLALKADEARMLADLSQQAGLVLQTGHQERVVCAALGLFDIAEPASAISILRAGTPPQDGRAMDISVIWDLMIHDIDLCHRLLGAQTSHMTCTGQRKLGAHLDLAEATLTIGHSLVHLEASRIAPARQRIMKLTYASGDIVLDFLARTVRNTSGYSLASNLDGLVPDPLGAADDMFFRACRFGEAPLISGREAAQAVATAQNLEVLALEAIEG